MKYSISDTNKLFKEYEKIQGLYCGETTDWQECVERYQVLEFKISKAIPMRNELENLNMYVLSKLRQDIIHEINRLCKKIWGNTDEKI